MSLATLRQGSGQKRSTDVPSGSVTSAWTTFFGLKISADGQRLVFVRSTGSARVSVLPNWAAHVDRQ